jgi:hypothetical protein
VGDKNKENLEEVRRRATALAKGKAKGLLKKAIKKNETARELSKSPSIRTLGALTMMLSKKSALKAKKKFKVDKDSSVTIKGEYNPRTKEKKIGVFYDKSF